MSSRSAIAISSCLFLAACVTPYAPPKGAPTATLVLGGLIDSKGTTAYYLKENAGSCVEIANLASGLKSTSSSSTVSVRADAPVVVEIVYLYTEKHPNGCRTTFEFVPESGATYLLRPDENYYPIRQTCVPVLQKRLDEKRTDSVPFRKVCEQK